MQKREKAVTFKGEPKTLVGPQIKPGTYTNRIVVNDVAPTLAQILGVETPTSSIGRVLAEILN